MKWVLNIYSRWVLGSEIVRYYARVRWETGKGEVKIWYFSKYLKFSKKSLALVNQNLFILIPWKKNPCKFEKGEQQTVGNLQNITPCFQWKLCQTRRFVFFSSFFHKEQIFFSFLQEPKKYGFWEQRDCQSGHQN